MLLFLFPMDDPTLSGWFCPFFQMLQTAKQKGEKELIAKKERLMLELVKLGSRAEEFSCCSELDMMQQVQSYEDSLILLQK